MNAFASRTAVSANSTLRPASVRVLRSHADRSFSILCRITGSICSFSSTGDDAPVLVPGAMAATSDASSKKNPAEAARPPLGVTYEITGTREASIFEAISRLASTSAAWSIQPQQHRRSVFARRLVDGVGNNLHRHRMNNSVDINGDDFLRLRAHRQAEQKCDPHAFRVQRLPAP